MNRKAMLTLILLVSALALGVYRFARSKPSTLAAAVTTPGNSTPLLETLADSQIRKAETVIKVTPNQYEGYNLLAAACLRKARETGDGNFNAKAEAAINQSLAIGADNSDALNLKAVLLVTRHNFQEAVEAARQAQAIKPDRPATFVALTDALVELGDYSQAIEAAQKLMDLRPDAAAYARTSHLRALHGDIQGAIEALLTAIQAADPHDAESLAWFRVQLGNQLTNIGKLKEAEFEFDRALQNLPDYYLALAAKGRARMLAEDYPGAIEFLRRAQTRTPLATTAILLGDLYTKLQRPDEARRQYEFADFIEQTGRVDSPTQLLAIFRAEHRQMIDEGVVRLREESLRRSDIYTLDALAWALYLQGNSFEAKGIILQAMRLGTRDARIHYHAGMIYRDLNDRQKALSHLRMAVTYKTSFDSGNVLFAVLQMDRAKQALQELEDR
jgi:tetratricopeptide (TPR) repeat protein